MLKIEFPSDNKELALAIGKALSEYGGGTVVAVVLTPSASDLVVPFNKEPACEAHTQTDGEITRAPEPGAAETFDKDVLEGVKLVEAIVATETSGVQAQTGTQSEGAGSATTSKPTHDEKGVQFIPAICGQAAKPFYASGPRKGQWKKRQGVDEVEYDRVYGEALAALGGTATGTQTERFDGAQESTASIVGGGVAKALEAQTLAGQQRTNDVANRSAEEVFGGGGGDPLTETVNEIPATPAEVFELYSQICQQGGAGVANQICATAGIANGTLIFSRPDLAPRLYKELTAQKAQLVGG